MPVRRKTRQKQKNRRLVIITGFVMGLIILSFSDLGLIRYFQLKSEHHRLLTQIEELKLHRDELQTEKKRLETDMDYIEQIAREKFRMVKPGEKVFRVKDNRTVPETD